MFRRVVMVSVLFGWSRVSRAASASMPGVRRRTADAGTVRGGGRRHAARRQSRWRVAAAAPAAPAARWIDRRAARAAVAGSAGDGRHRRPGGRGRHRRHAATGPRARGRRLHAHQPVSRRTDDLLGERHDVVHGHRNGAGERHRLRHEHGVQQRRVRGLRGRDRLHPDQPVPDRRDRLHDRRGRLHRDRRQAERHRRAGPGWSARPDSAWPARRARPARRRIPAIRGCSPARRERRVCTDRNTNRRRGNRPAERTRSAAPTGACTDCTVGASCAVTGKPCRTGATTCNTGAPVCAESGNVANGTVVRNEHGVQRREPACRARPGWPARRRTRATPARRPARRRSPARTRAGTSPTAASCGTNMVCNNGTCGACTRRRELPADEPLQDRRDLVRDGRARLRRDGKRRERHDVRDEPGVQRRSVRRVHGRRPRAPPTPASARMARRPARPA